MCSISNQRPVQLHLAFKPADLSCTDDMPYSQQAYLKTLPPSLKTKSYGHKLFRATDAAVGTTKSSDPNKDKQNTFALQPSVLNDYSKSTKLHPKYSVDSALSSLDTSFNTTNENIDCPEYGSHCRNSLVSPSPHPKSRKSSNYRQPTDTDELLRKVSVQLMRAQNRNMKKCDKTKNQADYQRSCNIESPELTLDNDISPTSDDCGQFSGTSTPDQQVSSRMPNVIDEDQLRLACEHIIEQQRKAWIAIKKAKKNTHRSKPALDNEKECSLSNISSDTISVKCRNEGMSSKVTITGEDGNISSEQFDSGHGSSEEHELSTKTERFSSTGSKNTLLPMTRPYYRYYIRKQKVHCPGLKPQTPSNQISDSISSPLDVAIGSIKKNASQTQGNRDISPEFSQSSHKARYSRATVSKMETLPEPNPLCTLSQSASYLFSHTGSGLTSCSSSSASCSSVVDVQQLTDCYCLESQEPISNVLGLQEEPCLSSQKMNAPKHEQTVKKPLQEKTNMMSLLPSSSSLTDLSPSQSSKNCSKKENNKTNVKLSSTLSRGCISCGFFTNACSKISQIRKTISAKTLTKSFREQN